MTDQVALFGIGASDPASDPLSGRSAHPNNCKWSGTAQGTAADDEIEHLIPAAVEIRDHADDFNDQLFRDYIEMKNINSARRVENKVVIVTGAAKGMGASHARLLAEHGAQVVLTDMTDAEGQALARDIGASAHYEHLDVRDGSMWKAVVDRTVTKFGRIDVLVNNAGIYPAPEDPFDEEVYHTVMAINVTGVFLGIKHVVPFMKANGGGSIINISSTAGLVGHIGPTAYTASKFAVTGLTRNLAVTLGPLGIRVNSVHPGAIQVAPRETWTKEMLEYGERIAQRVPLRKLGVPLETSYLIVHLASDESSYTTGASIAVDGGSIA